VQIETDRGEMRVIGAIPLTQSEFDIVPFSTLGGAIQINDGLDLRFALHALRMDSENAWLPTRRDTASQPAMLAVGGGVVRWPLL
jgi:hypothetical protein